MLEGPDIDINLHVHPPDSPEIGRHLLFRDWLRAHQDDRDLYERTKRKLASRTWKYVQNYADAKAGVIETILAKAEAGLRCRAWQPLAAMAPCRPGSRATRTWPRQRPFHCGRRPALNAAWNSA